MDTNKELNNEQVSKVTGGHFDDYKKDSDPFDSTPDTKDWNVSKLDEQDLSKVTGAVDECEKRPEDIKPYSDFDPNLDGGKHSIDLNNVAFDGRVDNRDDKGKWENKYGKRKRTC